ncbi:MAG: Rrf2 family transcriptional regulator, partial [Caulobacteraceae bacterium]
PASITLDMVLRAVGGAANLGCPPPGVKGCPVGERIPYAVRGVLEAVDQATMQSLSKVTVADLLRTAQAAPIPAPVA